MGTGTDTGPVPLAEALPPRSMGSHGRCQLDGRIRPMSSLDGIDGFVFQVNNGGQLNNLSKANGTFRSP